GMELEELDAALRDAALRDAALRDAALRDAALRDAALRDAAEHDDQPERIEHLLMVDAHYTWWIKGRSYLCRIIDMLHMGYVDEVLFGKEVTTRLPEIAARWAWEYRRRKRIEA
ncbi:MAG: DUF7687 domain-containing protein, partial [Planctomycetia bacterium]